MIECGDNFTVAGLTKVNRLVRVWAEGYEEFCKNNSAGNTTGHDDNFFAEGDNLFGTTENHQENISIDFVETTWTREMCEESKWDFFTTTRPLSTTFVTTDNGWTYNCTQSYNSQETHQALRGTNAPTLPNTTFDMVQIEVGIEGVALATSPRGVAADCIQRLGGGLSRDQVRWVLSNLGDSELLAPGNNPDVIHGVHQGFWRQNAIAQTDMRDDTKLWSELHSDCAPVTVHIIGPSAESFTYRYMADTVFGGPSEGYDSTRYTPTNAMATINEMADFVERLRNSEASVGFFPIRYAVSPDDMGVIAPLQTFGVREENWGGPFVDPKIAKFRDDLYLFSNRLILYMNQQKPASLSSTRPFLDYGLSANGTQDLWSAGAVPLLEWERVVMRTRAQTPMGVPWSDVQRHCGGGSSSGGRDITIAGSSTVFPIAQIWAAVYQIGCPHVEITLEGGGSSRGAGRVCANRESGTPVDIGDMSREWKSSEGRQRDGTDAPFVYDCLKGDPARSAIQVPVGIDGLTVATKWGGAAQECIEILGGLTMDQLRWIYSGYTDYDLAVTGWDPSSLRNSDLLSDTHLWSELDGRCQPLEIRVAGADDLSGTYEYFKEATLTDHENGESFDLSRGVHTYFASEKDEDLVAYLQVHGEAISYFGYSYYYQSRDSLYAVPVRNDVGVYTVPTDQTIGHGTYNPLARRVYMNLLNEPHVLRDTVPFVTFGLDPRSRRLVRATGYVPIPSDEAQTWVTRLLKEAPGVASDAAVARGDGSVSSVAVVGSSMGLCFVMAVAVCLCVARHRWRERSKSQQG